MAVLWKSRVAHWEHDVAGDCASHGCHIECKIRCGYRSMPSPFRNDIIALPTAHSEVEATIHMDLSVSRRA